MFGFLLRFARVNRLFSAVVGGLGARTDLRLGVPFGTSGRRDPDFAVVAAGAIRTQSGSQGVSAHHAGRAVVYPRDRHGLRRFHPARQSFPAGTGSDVPGPAERPRRPAPGAVDRHPSQSVSERTRAGPSRRYGQRDARACGAGHRRSDHHRARSSGHMSAASCRACGPTRASSVAWEITKSMRMPRTTWNSRALAWATTTCASAPRRLKFGQATLNLAGVDYQPSRKPYLVGAGADGRAGSVQRAALA